jgi:hypothetical protein
VSRNVVIGEHMGDPSGYAITHGEGGRFVVTRMVDGVEIGRYATRVEALTAAEADRAHRSG